MLIKTFTSEGSETSKLSYKPLQNTMKYIERIVIATLLAALAILVWPQLALQDEPKQQTNNSLGAPKKSVSQRKKVPVPEGSLIMGAGRFELKLARLTQGQRQTMVRFDSATGDYAVLDTEIGAWIAVELPLVSPAGSYENDAHIRLISDLVFD